MKRILTIVVAVSIALSMTACDGLDKILQTNLFGEMTKLKSADIIKAVDSGDPTALVDLARSPIFYDILKQDDSTKEKVVAAVDKAYKTETDATAKEDLAILAIDIQLKTTGGDEMIGKVDDNLDKIPTFFDGDTLKTKELFQAVIPDSVKSSDGTINPVAFNKLIDGFVKANAYFVPLGESLDDKDPTATPQFFNDEVNATEIALAALISAVVFQLDPPVNTSRGDYIIQIVNGQTTPAAFTMPSLDSGSSLGNLLAASGLGELLPQE